MSEREQIPTLTIKDKLNYPYYLGNAILTFQKSILNQEFSEREIVEAIKGFVALIPQSWEDEQFKKDMKQAKIKKKIDIRPSWCGVKISEESCKESKIKIFVEKETYDYGKLFRACINLLDRRGLTGRVTKTDRLLGERFNDGQE